MKPKFIIGCVIDELGLPVQGAFVTVDCGDGFKDIAIVTNFNGNFKMECPGESFSLAACTKSGLKGVRRVSKNSRDKSNPIICVHC